MDVGVLVKVMLFVPPLQIESLAAALVELARDATLRRRLGTRGRQRFVDQFRHPTMTRQLRAIYERVLASRADGPRPK